MSSVSNEFVPAEVFPPGDFLREELAERGWTQEVFAEIIGKSERLVNEIIAAKREITPPTAKVLGEALGTSAQFWLNLEGTYRLYLEARKRGGDDSVTRRARLYSFVPVKEMIKRGWIARSSNLDVLESSVCRFFDVPDLDMDREFIPHAARKSASYDSVNAPLLTWLYRVRALARSVTPAGTFRNDSVEKLVAKLKLLLESPSDTSAVGTALSEHGVRFVVVEPLSRTRVDGVTFWLNRKSPVVALSFRYDRIDWFWHTLMHELGHIAAGDGQDGERPLVDDFEGMTGDLPRAEKRANDFAAAALIPQPALNDFIKRTRPLYSKLKIEEFAREMDVHPGLVVGQLQHRHEIDWSHSRNYLVKVRDFATSGATVDGWANPAFGA